MDSVEFQRYPRPLGQPWAYQSGNQFNTFLQPRPKHWYEQEQQSSWLRERPDPINPNQFDPNENSNQVKPGQLNRDKYSPHRTNPNEVIAERQLDETPISGYYVRLPSRELNRGVNKCSTFPLAQDRDSERNSSEGRESKKGRHYFWSFFAISE